MTLENEEIVFGQYLVRFSRFKNSIDQNMVNKALEIQRSERESGEYRRIGEILFHDMGVFLFQGDLDKALEEFEDFKKKYMD